MCEIYSQQAFRAAHKQNSDIGDTLPTAIFHSFTCNITTNQIHCKSFKEILQWVESYNIRESSMEAAWSKNAYLNFEPFDQMNDSPFASSFSIIAIRLFHKKNTYVQCIFTLACNNWMGNKRLHWNQPVNKLKQ